jgi:hypothetical protein
LQAADLLDLGVLGLVLFLVGGLFLSALYSADV